MMGSEIFIIVALRCTENSMAAPSSQAKLDADRAVLGNRRGLLGVVGGLMCDVRFRMGVHAPTRCGCALAQALTEAGARRSELPSRRAGLTAILISFQ